MPVPPVRRSTSPHRILDGTIIKFGLLTSDTNEFAIYTALVVGPLTFKRAPHHPRADFSRHLPVVTTEDDIHVSGHRAHVLAQLVT